MTQFNVQEFGWNKTECPKTLIYIIMLLPFFFFYIKLSVIKAIFEGGLAMVNEII